MMKKVIVFILLIFLSLGCGGSNISNPANQPSPPSEPTPPSSPITSSGLYVSAWVANYQWTRGLQSFQTNAGIFDEINPVWYNLNPDYFTNPSVPFIIYNQNKIQLTSTARAYGINLIPTIQNFGATNFDPVVISRILNDAILRERHLTEIVNLVLSEGFDGIDLDYESLYASDRNVFTLFIRELGLRLRQYQKKLSVTVYAKTADVRWDGPGAQDWNALAGSVDTLKLMVYDYHWLTFHPGPLAPLDWLRDVIGYARTIPGLAGKVVIGLPLYGLDWGTGTAAREVMYADVGNILNNNPGTVVNRSTVVRHSGDPICSKYYTNAEPHFNYVTQGNTHTVFYQDAESIRERLAIIASHRDWIKGITFWRLGGEDLRTWDEVRKYK